MLPERVTELAPVRLPRLLRYLMTGGAVRGVRPVQLECSSCPSEEPVAMEPVASTETLSYRLLRDSATTSFNSSTRVAGHEMGQQICPKPQPTVVSV